MQQICAEKNLHFFLYRHGLKKTKKRIKNQTYFTLIDIISFYFLNYYKRIILQLSTER